MNVGIVGHEAAKFTPETERVARRVIRELLAPADAVLVSGHCHLGGVDIWAEEEADALGRAMLIFPPASLTWDRGFKPRNILIADTSDIVHCLVVDAYPASYHGMRFLACYHCARHRQGGPPPHIKSGGCWTAWYCRQHAWHVIRPESTV